MSVGGQVVARHRGKRIIHQMQVVLVRGQEVWGFQDLLLRGRPGIIRTRAGYVGPAGRRPSFRRRGGHQLAIEITFNPALLPLADVVSFIVDTADGAASAGASTVRRPTQRPGLVYYRGAEEFTSAADALREVVSGVGECDLYELLVPVETFYEAEPEHQE